MTLRVLSIFAALSLFGSSTCHNSPKAGTARSNWIVSYPRIPPETKIGRQMPPYHEPDAVLFNLGGGSEQPGMPGGGVPRVPAPGGPGIFGIPGGEPGVFGVPGGPGVFGVPGNAAPRPGVFGFPRLPGFPNGFGFPRGHPAAGGPGVFVTPGQGNPVMPNRPGVFGVPVGQGGSGVLGTGVFGVPNGPSRPGVFSVSGSGNIPLPGVPGYFTPGRSPNLPVAPDTPGTGGMVPEIFIPRGVNRFGPGGIFPGVFYPEAPTVPNQPEDPGSFGGSFPYGGTGGREIYDDPEADIFPIVDKSPSFPELPS